MHVPHPIPYVGSSHPLVRQYVECKTNRAAVPHVVAAEGLWSLRLALDARVDVDVVYVCVPLVRGEETARAVDRAHDRGAEVVEVSERVFRRLVSRDGPDGVAALVRLRSWRLDDLPAGGRVVVGDRLELAGNVGAIVRCADGAGASAVVLTGHGARVTHPQAVKASMGTVFSMPVVTTTAERAVEWARGSGLRVVAADPAASTSYRSACFERPTAVVVGSERFGVSPEWREAADLLVSIPMLGVADSLNVGHAAALLLYETVHQQQAAMDP